MFKYFKRKEKQLSKIISQKFETIADYDMYNFNNCIKCTFEVKACDENTYFIVVSSTQFLSIEVKIYDLNGKELNDITTFGEIKVCDNCYKFHLRNVNNQNSKYQGMGFGTLMLQALIASIRYYEEMYDVIFEVIYGELGTDGKSKPEKSIPLYLSFDGYRYSEDKKLYLKKETLNRKDCEIFYRIA